MGLSDEERRTGIYHAVRQIMDAKRQWEESYQLRDGCDKEHFVQIRTLIDQIWHAFLGKQSNSMHWFMGSSSVNRITNEPRTPWEVAVVHHCEQAYDGLERKKAEAEDPSLKDFNDTWHGDEDKPFNALKFTNIKMLVQHGDDYRSFSSGCVFDIYQWIEQLLYYLRRYPDDFQDNFEELSILASKISGECFEAFMQNEDFAKAYVIHDMMDMIYGGRYPYDNDDDDDETIDVVAKMLRQHNMHHDFTRLMKWKFEDFLPYHVELTKAKILAEKNAKKPHLWGEDLNLMKVRLWTTLNLVKSPHEYVHISKKILELLEKSTLREEVPKISELLKKMQKKFQEKKQEETNDNSDDQHERQLECYGHHASMDLHHFLEDKKTVMEVSAKKTFKKSAKKKVPKKTSKKSAKKKVPKKTTLYRRKGDQ